VSRLAEVNAIADRAEGFVWRLQDDSGTATALRPWGADVIVNMSVWESVESLRRYVFSSEHLSLLRARRDWFAPPKSAHMVLWWVRTGQRPTLAQGRRRLDLLEAQGPGPQAFTFRRPFGPAPGGRG